MNVLKESTDPQTLNYTPEVNGVNFIVLFDEQTRQKQELTVTSEQVSYFERVTEIFDLKENRFYNYFCFIKDETDTTIMQEVYKGRIFCTNQELESFKILNGEFKQYPKPNEFVIYE